MQESKQGIRDWVKFLMSAFAAKADFSELLRVGLPCPQVQ